MSRRVHWIKVIFDYMNKTTKFERNVRKIRNVSMSDGTCKCELDVTEDHVNADGHFPLGLATTLVDIVGSYALLAHGDGHSAVSTNIHVKNLKPAFVGDVLVIDAKVYSVEHPLAYVEVELSKKETNEIVARGQHTMFVVPPIDYKP